MDLEGITVVALEQAVAAPYASSRLADAGARVIKIERAEGDFARRYDSLVNGDSAYFVWLNRGKESVCLNLKDEADKSILAAMIASADVFIQNLAPGAVERMGFAMEGLLAQHPSLICCSITGYGRDGPYRDQKAYDLLVQAEVASVRSTVPSTGPRGSAFRFVISLPACSPSRPSCRRFSPEHAMAGDVSSMSRSITRWPTG